MTCSWLVLTLLGQSATITYEPNPPAEALPAAVQPSTWDAGTPAPSTPPADEAQPEDKEAAPKAAASPQPASKSRGSKVTAAPRTFDPSARGRSLFRGAAEVTAYSLPSGTPGGGQDLYLSALPILAIDAGDSFGFEIGAPLRLRILDSPPAQRDQDIGLLLRRSDWDELSDFGQVLRDLRIFSGDSPLILRAGALYLRTVGRGHLVNRYSNQLNPDYHPAGASAGIFLGPLRAELMASDLLAPRLFAADVSVDLGHLLGAGPDGRGRYHAGLSGAHDFGAAGGTTPPITLLQLDGDAALYRTETLQAFAYAGVGTRMLTADLGMGALLGASLDALLPDGGQLGFKLEGRQSGGGFRFGLFGPAYELSRFSDRGLGLGGVADARLPNGLSAYTELQFGAGAFGDAGLARGSAVLFSTSAEWFAFGRLDVDGALTVRLGGGAGAFTGRFTGVDVLGTPRYQGSGELRYRFAPALYLVAEGGLVFFPQPDHTLNRGFFAALGAGADFSR